MFFLRNKYILIIVIILILQQIIVPDIDIEVDAGLSYDPLSHIHVNKSFHVNDEHILAMEAHLNQAHDAKDEHLPGNENKSNEKTDILKNSQAESLAAHHQQLKDAAENWKHLSQEHLREQYRLSASTLLRLFLVCPSCQMK